MLLKLLKNDLKSVFKYWWIGAVISFCLSFAGGFLLNILNNNAYYSDLLTALCTIAFVFVICGISAFSFLYLILVVIRYYRNFFTDEGYLTFTLPVKRNQLLLSKFITSIIASATTGMLIAIEAAIVVLIGLGDSKDFWITVKDILAAIPDFLSSNWYYIIEGLIILVGLVFFSTLLVFACVTISSLVMKKAKVFWAIVMYYGVTNIISFFFQICFSLGGVWLYGWVSTLTLVYVKSFFALFLFVIILMLAVVCMGLYTLVHWLLDKKLNLN